MARVGFKCERCGKRAAREAGSVNRARRHGMRLFCDRKCAGAGRRKNRTVSQRKAEKRLYDIEYRARNRAMLKAKKAEYFQRTYDPAKAAVERKLRMPRHVEYCRRPEYVAWKREYDRQLRAREYGPFADSYLLFLDLNREVNARMSDYDVRVANGTLNKKLQRRKYHGKAFGQQ